MGDITRDLQTPPPLQTAI